MTGREEPNLPRAVAAAARDVLVRARLDPHAPRTRLIADAAEARSRSQGSPIETARVALSLVLARGGAAAEKIPVAVARVLAKDEDDKGCGAARRDGVEETKFGDAAVDDALLQKMSTWLVTNDPLRRCATPRAAFASAAQVCKSPRVTDKSVRDAIAAELEAAPSLDALAYASARARVAIPFAAALAMLRKPATRRATTIATVTPPLLDAVKDATTALLAASGLVGVVRVRFARTPEGRRPDANRVLEIAARVERGVGAADPAPALAMALDRATRTAQPVAATPIVCERAIAACLIGRGGAKVRATESALERTVRVLSDARARVTITMRGGEICAFAVGVAPDDAAKVRGALDAALAGALKDARHARAHVASSGARRAAAARRRITGGSRDRIRTNFGTKEERELKIARDVAAKARRARTAALTARKAARLSTLADRRSARGAPVRASGAVLARAQRVARARDGELQRAAAASWPRDDGDATDGGGNDWKEELRLVLAACGYERQHARLVKHDIDLDTLRACGSCGVDAPLDAIGVPRLARAAIAEAIEANVAAVAPEKHDVRTAQIGDDDDTLTAAHAHHAARRRHCAEPGANHHAVLRAPVAAHATPCGWHETKAAMNGPSTFTKNNPKHSIKHSVKAARKWSKAGAADCAYGVLPLCFMMSRFA